jgi:AcrR family transcriptional regulator
MRAVAQAAGTTTPTLYERFRDKHDLLAFLQDHARQKIFASIRTAESASEACRRALQFMVHHENEHRLLIANWPVRLARKQPTPSYDFLKALLAKELGGSPEERTPLAMALVAQVYGGATMLMGSAIDSRVSREFRRACLDACDALIAAAKARNVPSAKRRHRP